MNYRYKKENKRKEVIIIYIVCIIILILTIISNTSILMKEMKQASEDSYIRLWIVWLGSMIGVILFDVYESREYKPMGDYDAEDMKISENGIELTFNPFKLYKVIEKKYKIDWFGNAVAVDFHYENE